MHIRFALHVHCVSAEGHPPYRVVVDASQGYGHVVAELYTTRLGGLSYNDFRLAQTIDSALFSYRKRAAAAASASSAQQPPAKQ